MAARRRFRIGKRMRFRKWGKLGDMARWNRKRIAGWAAAITLSIWLPVALAQNYFRYNAYILPLCGLALVLLYIVLGLTGKTALEKIHTFHHGFGAARPLEYMLVMAGCGGLLVAMLGGGEWYAIHKSQQHVADLRKADTPKSPVFASSAIPVAPDHPLATDYPHALESPSKSPKPKPKPDKGMRPNTLVARDINLGGAGGVNGGGGGGGGAINGGGGDGGGGSLCGGGGGGGGGAGQQAGKGGNGGQANPDHKPCLAALEKAFPVPSLAPGDKDNSGTPPTINNCPNGICISGGTATNPIVNNFGPPPPQLFWEPKKQNVRNGGSYESDFTVHVISTITIGVLGISVDSANKSLRHVFMFTRNGSGITGTGDGTAYNGSASQTFNDVTGDFDLQLVAASEDEFHITISCAPVACPVKPQVH